MLDLFILETCPFCRKVMDFAEQNNINFNKHDVSNAENLKELIRLGGKEQVPFLSDGSITMYESDDIIEYLKKRNL